MDVTEKMDECNLMQSNWICVFKCIIVNIINCTMMIFVIYVIYVILVDNFIHIAKSSMSLIVPMSSLPYDEI
jgi:hypothetical protein